MSECEEHFTHDTKSGIETQVTEVNVFWTTEYSYQNHKRQGFYSNFACFFSSTSFSHNSLALPMRAMRYPVVMSPDLDSYTPSA
jgi:hypothetical protein